MIISILEPLPTHIVTSPLTSLYSFCNSRFELLFFATEPVSNSEGLLWTLVKYTSITCISNIPLFTLPSFLIHQILGVVPLPVTNPFAVEALSLRLRTRLGLLHLSSNLLAVLLEVPLLPFTLLLKLVVLSTINTWWSFLISTFIDFIIMKSSGVVFAIPCIL